MNQFFVFLEWLSDFFYKKIRYHPYPRCDRYIENEESNVFEMYRQRTIVSG
jgi:hypothetical protein